MKKYTGVFIFALGIIAALAIDVAAESIISAGAVNYSNSKTSATTVSGALDELFSTVDINDKIGTTDISGIGDGTITGAISSTYDALDYYFPDYSRVEVLYNESTIPDATSFEITIPKTGYYYAFANTYGEDVAPFIRILASPSSSWVHLYSGFGEKGTHKYLTTPMYLFKQGQVITIQIDAYQRQLFYIPLMGE